MEKNWIRTNEVEDVTGSIRHVIRTVEFLADDPFAWKWIILALHSALQGACICHLTTTAAPVGAVSDRNAVDWLAYFEDSRTNRNATPPKTYLMTLPELLKAIRKPYSAGDSSNAAGITVSDSEFRWLKRFHDDFRNQFVHFEPMGWSIEVSGIPEIAKLVARIIQDIFSMGWGFRHQSLVQREDMQRCLDTLASLEWPI